MTHGDFSHLLKVVKIFIICWGFDRERDSSDMSTSIIITPLAPFNKPARRRQGVILGWKCNGGCPKSFEFRYKYKSTADIPVCSSTDTNVCTTTKKQLINETTNIFICFCLFILNVNT